MNSTADRIPEHRTIEALSRRKKLRRKVHGIAAALLPYRADGGVDVDAFQKNLVSTNHIGLMNAVNMDTGYVNLLTESEKHEVLRWTREALGKDVMFVAGAYIESGEGDVAELLKLAHYRSYFRLQGSTVNQPRKKSRRMPLSAKVFRRCWPLN
ncbi:MAG: hypothetical protein DMG79_01210 [Acidobacteria bacterium]|nr:MAG: hypothetical protein DMG79_01210 [Acidobacteriota bacterium]